jgi:hypothetical protein
VAVNVTSVPEQIVLPEAEMLTLGVKTGLTVTDILLLVAGFPAAQGVASEVKITVTTSLLLSVVLVKVALLVPALTPFNCHW